MRRRPVVLVDNIPACLRARDQWVVWRYVDRDGKPTKLPFNARTGTAADSTDSSTWSSFDDAVAAWSGDERSDGIGYVFSKDDPYAGVDLDDALDRELGTLKPWAQALVDVLDTYCEVSPSGCGLKLFLVGGKPGTRCRKRYADGEVEVYDRDRFFTVTGDRLDGTAPEVNERQAALADVYGRIFGRTGEEPVLTAAPATPPSDADDGGDDGDVDDHASDLTDEQILEKAQRSRKGGPKFTDLRAGRWQVHFRSQSEADSSLVFTLAFYTKDPAQIDRLFRTSGLMRPKWDERHGARTYGELTIDNALAHVTGQWRPGSRRAAGSGEAEAGEAAAGSPGFVPLGTRDPATGRIVLSPTRTLPTAEAFVSAFHDHPAGRTLHSYAGALLAWRGNRFAEAEEGALRQRLLPWLHGALRYVYNRRTELHELSDFEANPTTVNAALESLRAHAHLPAHVTPPCWLGRDDGDDDDHSSLPDPREVLPCRSANLHVPSGRLFPPTPRLFNVNALDFDYDPDAEPPERWVRFLEQLWGDDLESVHLLQAWMGYCLVADTSQQKMLMVVGPKRSGKGTIGRVLTRLVGPGNVAGPTTSSLAGPFGLQPLIGKSLAVVSDARFGGDGVGVVVERLLCISGEDALTVDRKFLGSVTMKLPTRFVFLTNELPRMNDASGALAGRFVFLRLTRSFYGREDTTLTSQLMAELPGILLWAIEGLKRLRARGHFVQPASVAEAVRELEDLASPVGAFVRDQCVVGAGHRVWVDDLYAAWKRWCEQDGRTSVSTKQTFGRDLLAAVPGIACRRNHGQGRFYDGIALAEAEVPS